MMDQNRRLQLAEELVRRLASAVRCVQLYAGTHPLVGRNVAALVEAMKPLHADAATITVGFIGDEIIVGDLPLPKPATSNVSLSRRLRDRGIERLSIEPDVAADEVHAVVNFLAEPGALDEEAEGPPRTVPSFEHIRIGRIAVERELESDAADMPAIRRLYDDAVSAVEGIWEDVRHDLAMDVRTAQAIVQGLAQAVARNRSALLALTTLRNYDNYTFTHMVNVSILTMAQARSLGVDGPLLREFGLAALMHDIGKVRVPVAILQKPDRLTSEELAIMKRHPVDGAEILRRTPDMVALAPMVAFEHHRRYDGTGYPEGISREKLNLATVMTSIADVYDAMRSQRAYQRVFPSERVVEVLQRNDGRHFDQHLVRRFVQLLGIYPAGTAVRLDTGEVAVVVRVNASDGHRPRVRVLLSQQGERMDPGYDVDLWAVEPGGGRPSSISAPVDAELLGLDPLAQL